MFPFTGLKRNFNIKPKVSETNEKEPEKERKKPTPQLTMEDSDNNEPLQGIKEILFKKSVD